MRYLFAILDMDGVLWRSDQPIGDLAEIFMSLSIKFRDFVFCTNNSTKPPSAAAQKLSAYGVNFPSRKIITSSNAVAELLIRRFPSRGNLLIIGEEGLRSALDAEGFSVSDKDPCAVVVGLDRQVDYRKLCSAALAIRKGVPFYGTNIDLTFPTPDGLIPGAGALIELLRSATGISPIVAGKPEPYMMELAMRMMKSEPAETLVIGDRLETDIAGGMAAHCPTALVLSGVTTREDARKSTFQANLVAADLAELLEML